MASSTEEVSVAPGDTNNDRTADDMTSSEKQFAVFKDFDFLEYELESQGVRIFLFSPCTLYLFFLIRRQTFFQFMSCLMTMDVFTVSFVS